MKQAPLAWLSEKIQEAHAWQVQGSTDLPDSDIQETESQAGKGAERLS